MTLDTTFAGYYPPIRHAGSDSSAISMSNNSLRFGYMITIPKTGTLTHISIRLNTVTQDGTATARVETMVTSTGRPSGTLAYTNATGSLPVTIGMAGALTIPINSPTGITVTQGDKVGIVIGNSNAIYSIFVGNTYDTTQPGTNANSFPCGQFWNGSSWTVYSTANMAICLQYSDGPVTPGGCATLQTTSTVSSAVGTSPVYVGNRFTLPMNCVCTGAWVSSDLDGDSTIRLIDANGTSTMGSAVLLAACRGAITAALSYVTFPSAITLLKNQYYRIVIQATSATASTIAINTLIANPSGTYGIEDGIMGKCCEYTSTDNPISESAWTQDPTKRVKIGLYLSQLDIGGGSIAADLNGGFI